MFYFVIVIALGFWYWTLHRGRLAVRAFIYLSVLSRTGSEDAANAEALSLGFFAATDYVELATAYANTCCSGSQLSMIAAARKSGYRG